MDVLDHFELRGGIGYFRPQGQVSMYQAVGLVTSAILYARSQGIRRLLANVTELTGFSSPSLVERYYIADEWARVAGGQLHLALVVRAEMIDPEKFGVTVAVNRGLNGDVFAIESEAWAWLLADRSEPGSNGERDE